MNKKSGFEQRLGGWGRRLHADERQIGRGADDGAEAAGEETCSARNGRSSRASATLTNRKIKQGRTGAALLVEGNVLATIRLLQLLRHGAVGTQSKSGISGVDLAGSKFPAARQVSSVGDKRENIYSYLKIPRRELV